MTKRSFGLALAIGTGCVLLAAESIATGQPLRPLRPRTNPTALMNVEPPVGIASIGLAGMRLGPYSAALSQMSAAHFDRPRGVHDGPERVWVGGFELALFGRFRPGWYLGVTRSAVSYDVLGAHAPTGSLEISYSAKTTSLVVSRRLSRRLYAEGGPAVHTRGYSVSSEGGNSPHYADHVFGPSIGLRCYLDFPDGGAASFTIGYRSAGRMRVSGLDYRAVSWSTRTIVQERIPPATVPFSHLFVSIGIGFKG